MKSAVTLCLFPEARGGPFVLWDEAAEGFRRAAELGFDAVEIHAGGPDEIDANQLRELVAKHRMQIAAFGSGAGWVKHKLRLTDPAPEKRRAAQEFAMRMVEIAGAFNAPIIVGSMQGRWEGEVSRKAAIEWLGESLESLAGRAQRLGVPLFYEYLNRYETNVFNNMQESVQFLDELRAPNLKLLADLFHMNIEEADIATALRIAGDRIGHVHFVDSNRRAIGFGHTLMPPIMEALRGIGYGGYLSAEVLPLPDSQSAAVQSIEAFRKWTQP